MRKNKIGDILFGLLLLGFILSKLTGCGQSGPSPPAVPPPTVNYVPTAATVDTTDKPEIAIGDDKDNITEIPETDASVDIAIPEDAIYIEAEDLENDAYVETRVPENDTYAETEVLEIDVSDMGSIESIKSVCGLVAPVETSVSACHWDSYGEHPYDVVFDYGSEYQVYVDACDWSLVFDADYYMSEFPMLALQYHYDEEELLFHFQTVGIHEGRQGSEDFNVYAYAMNNDDGLLGAFDDDYEGYYLYYMLNYDTEEGTNTVTCANQANVRDQYALDLTALQNAEWNAVCDDRIAVDVDTVSIYAELCAFANYRAYLNAHDGYKAHDWAIDNINLFSRYMNVMNGTAAAENTVTFHNAVNRGETTEHYYYSSKDHYDAMVDARYDKIGVSNICNGKTVSSQFDYYIDLD